MSTEPESFLARWSRRKRAAEEAKQPADNAVPEPPSPAPANAVSQPNAPGSASVPTRELAATTEVQLPPIESLDGLRSDYQSFFQQPVADELRHAALRKLFADPHFNKMDMLDVYVDDYTQFEPLPAALRMRLPSARSFLSDSERAEVEAAEAPTGAAGDAAMDASVVDSAADDTSVGSTLDSSATTTAAPAASDTADKQLDASSSPGAPASKAPVPDPSSS